MIYKFSNTSVYTSSFTTSIGPESYLQPKASPKITVLKRIRVEQKFAEEGTEIIFQHKG